MSIRLEGTATKPVHPWLGTLRLAFVGGPSTPLLDEVSAGVLRHFGMQGHHVQERPDDSTDLILTTARFNDPVSWRDAPMFVGRKRFGLSRTPAVYTLAHARTDDFEQVVARLERLGAEDEPNPADYTFPGMTPEAYRTLHEQARRGGPILALERVAQAQVKSFRIVLVVGDERPEEAYHFDLVGAYPRTEAGDLEAFYDEIVLRIATTLSTREVAEHETVGEPVPREVWERLSTPKAMCAAARELAKRDFFTDTVYVANLVQVPSVPGAIASQYSEGCFATWDPELGALVATVTGSIRPVNKGSISEEDLAVIVGVRPDGMGALVRPVEGKRNDPPSSEAVEMMDMDEGLPTVNGLPIVRSKLHGHRGVAAYDPDCVEYVALDAPYYHYLVSCASEAQARGVKAAFARSQALRNPDDPRQVVFTVLPGHGSIMVEKWVAGKAPFQVLWEYMDAGYLRMESRVPQGPMWYVPEGRMMALRTDDTAPL